MLIIEQIFKVKDISKLMKQLLPEHALPNFLFSIKTYKIIVVSVKKHNNPIGIAYGVIENKSNIFFIHLVYLEKEFRIQSNVIYLIESLLRAYNKVSDGKKAVWTYNQKPGSTDFHQIIISQISFCRISNFTDLIKYRINTSEFSQIKKYDWVVAQNLKLMGYNFVKLFECGYKIKKRIQEKEKARIKEKDYLSPFVNNMSDDEIDKHSSLILIRIKDNEPLGWVISIRLPENGVGIICCYMYTQERKGILGILFLGYVMKIMKSRFDYLSFEVGTQNLQMMRFVETVRKYNEPIIQTIGFCRTLELDLIK